MGAHAPPPNDKAQRDRKAARRKRTLSLGLVSLGALALAGGALYETNAAARRKACEQALARGEPNPEPCRRGGSSARGSSGHSSSGHSSTGAASSHSSTQGVHFGGFGSTGAAHAHGGG